MGHLIADAAVLSPRQPAWRCMPRPAKHGQERAARPRCGSQKQAAAPGEAALPGAAAMACRACGASVAVETVGGTQLVAHYAQELLALLQYVEVNERYLEVGLIVVALHAVVVVLAYN